MAVVEASGTERRDGVLYGTAAYLLWGVFPLYFPLLKPAGAGEILAQRIVWSLVAVLFVLWAGRSFGSLRQVLRDRRKVLLLGVAAVLIAANWGTFIYAVNSEHVIEASLGYFITPLVSAGFGVLVLREHLRARQAVALGIGFIAVLVLAVDYGRLPWIALVLAASFGTYGLVKKIVDVGAAESLAVETLILLPFALGCVVILQAVGVGTFTQEAPGHALLLMATGIVTALPLLLFSASVTRVPLTVIGMLQYLAPVLQFLVGLLIAGESMPASRWIGFGLVWLALVVLSGDLLQAARRTRVAAVQEPV